MLPCTTQVRLEPIPSLNPRVRSPPVFETLMLKGFRNDVLSLGTNGAQSTTVGAVAAVSRTECVELGCGGDCHPPVDVVCRRTCRRTYWLGPCFPSRGMRHVSQVCV